MIQDRIKLDIPFTAYQMGRIDELLNEKIAQHGLEKGVIRLEAPEGVIFTTIEYEPNLVLDFKDAWISFEKDLKPSLHPDILSKIPRNAAVIPFNLGRLVIGDYQQVVLFTSRAFDNLELIISFVPSNAILGLESIHTTTELQTHDITDIVERTLMNTDDCNLTLISPDPSVILYTLNPFLYKEFVEFLQKVAPRDRIYRHSHAWAESVGFMHIRASFFSQLLTIPIRGGKLNTGDERLYLTELDTSGTRRDIYFEVWK